jgi:hypothetical protein
MIALAGSPGTAVDPTCSMRSAALPSAALAQGTLPRSVSFWPGLVAVDDRDRPAPPVAPLGGGEVRPDFGQDGACKRVTLRRGQLRGAQARGVRCELVQVDNRRAGPSTARSRRQVCTASAVRAIPAARRNCDRGAVFDPMLRRGFNSLLDDGGEVDIAASS